MKTMNTMNTLKNSVAKYFEKHLLANELFSQLLQAGDIYLIGGALREYCDRADLSYLRDIDIIVDVRNEKRWQQTLKSFPLRQNRFGGYKLCDSGVQIDAWEIGHTWAFREGIIKASHTDYAKLLPETVFLNIDAIVYDWTRERWYDQHYHKAMEDKVLDIVLQKNPQTMLNIVRAFVFQERYQMALSAQLEEVICMQRRLYQTTDAFVAALVDEQRKHYCKEIVSPRAITKKIKEAY